MSISNMETYGDPDQAEIATILPCLFAHNLVFA